MPEIFFRPKEVLKLQKISMIRLVSSWHFCWRRRLEDDKGVTFHSEVVEGWKEAGQWGLQSGG